MPRWTFHLPKAGKAIIATALAANLQGCYTLASVFMDTGRDYRVGTTATAEPEDSGIQVRVFQANEAPRPVRHNDVKLGILPLNFDVLDSIAVYVPAFAAALSTKNIPLGSLMLFPGILVVAAPLFKMPGWENYYVSYPDKVLADLIATPRRTDLSGKLPKALLVSYTDVEGEARELTIPLRETTYSQVVPLPLDAGNALPPIAITMVDKYGDALQRLQLDRLPIYVAGSGNRPAASPEPGAAARMQHAVARATDVDVARETPTKLPHAVALVVGVEEYGDNIPGVAHAAHDAKIFKQYLIKSLGVPSANIIYLTDANATLANIRKAVEGQLQARIKPGQSDVFVYFAGHGAPDLRKKYPYLVPFDGDVAYPSATCLSLADLYAGLADLEARSATVVLDSCFSGSSGRSGTVKSLAKNARPLAIEVRTPVAPKGVSVFSAATNSQVSSSLDSKRHGLFTYYFLKGLQGEADTNGDGNVVVKEMAKFLEKHVPAEARRLNRDQTPVLSTQDPDHVLIRYR